MTYGNCLVCFLPIEKASEVQYHLKCCIDLFGQKNVPIANFNLNEINKIALDEVNKRVSVTGVQPKISLDFSPKHKNRLTIVGLWGKYILKPPHSDYQQMPEIESITMRMAQVLGIETAKCGLIKLQSGEYAYIAKRFDRKGETKLSVEDFCQLSEKLTEDKYNSSIEKVGKIVLKYTTIPGFEILKLFKLTVFNFLIGNADMHLKNYSLIRSEEGNVSLTPAYDLLSTKILLPEDKEESALTISGKKHNIRKKDFVILGKTLKIPEKVIENELKIICSEMKSKGLQLLNNQNILKRKAEYIAYIKEKLLTF